MKLLALFFPLCGFALAEPQKPTDRVLDPTATMAISIHPASTTLLVFPEPVTLIVGAGLSDGSNPGDVHYQHAKNPKHLVLRQLNAGSKVLMQVAMGEQTYAFELQSGERPDNIIRFHKNPIQGPAVELAEEEVTKHLLEVPKERQVQLIRLVHGEPILRPKLPEAYENFVVKEVSDTVEEHGLKVTVDRVARFADEDAIIFIVRIQNRTTNAIDLSKRRAAVLVGDRRIKFSPSHISPSRNIIPPGQQIDCSVVLVGNGQGQRLHLDPRKNRFLLTFTPSNP